MTCTVLHWIPVFTRPQTVEILLDSLNYLIQDGLKLYAYIILENHMHLVAQSERLDRDMARFKSYTAKQMIRFLSENKIRSHAGAWEREGKGAWERGILDQLAFYKQAHKRDRAYQFWQEGVHPEWIQNQTMMGQKIEYIHQNPVKRGYVDKPEHWRYSSARNYLGMEGLLEVCRQW